MSRKPQRKSLNIFLENSDMKLKETLKSVWSYRRLLMNCEKTTGCFGNDLARTVIACLIWLAVAVGLVSFIEAKKEIRTPAYLYGAGVQMPGLIRAESAVFDIIRARGEHDADFAIWFNGLNDTEKRGFILYVRSRALSSVLGDRVGFSDEHWLVNRPERTADLAAKLIGRTPLRDMAGEYDAIRLQAEEQQEAFLGSNEWLASYLGENYDDFRTGLFYFFAEHVFTDKGIREKASRFSGARGMIRSVSDAIISNRGYNSRISPREDVTDDQIREIVAASFFTELFYGIPADFMLLISAYESNFAMEYWYGGVGTTQQTMRAANTILQSEYWIDRVYEASGVKIRHQLVTVSALDNVFLCITEAAKTIAIKAAELKISTHDIKPVKRVRFGGKLLPVTWVTAYKYNGSRRYAQRYARTIHYYYKSRKWWLKSFADIRAKSRTVIS